MAGIADDVADLAGVVLAAGAGTRLRPLTRWRPKALCPVGGVPLVDLALERVGAVTSSVAVNVHHGRPLLEAHLAGRAHLSVEAGEALGTAGALGHLRDWIGGRPTVVVNADAWTDAPLAALFDGWDGERIRLLVVRPPSDGSLPPKPNLAGALLPWRDVEGLDAEPSGLWEVSWGAALDAGRLDAVAVRDAAFVDCATPGDYLAANLASSGGEPVVGDGALVAGELVRSVVWPGGVVRPGERLVQAIRVGDRCTVLVR